MIEPICGLTVAALRTLARSFGLTRIGGTAVSKASKAALLEALGA